MYVHVCLDVILLIDILIYIYTYLCHLCQYSDESSPQIAGLGLEAKNRCPPPKVGLPFYVVLVLGHSWCEYMLLFHRVSSMFGIVWRRRIFVEVFGRPGNLASWTLTRLQKWIPKKQCHAQDNCTGELFTLWSLWESRTGKIHSEKMLFGV